LTLTWLLDTIQTTLHSEIRMTEQHLSKLLLLALLLAAPAFAETGIGSDETAVASEAEDHAGAFNLDVFSNGLTADDADSPARPAVKLENKPNDLWQRIRSGYAMADQQSPSASAQESWYAARPEYVNRMVGRSQKYLYHIVEEVEKRGMPTEIALLPMVESAFNPQAYSRSRASGIWQFMPATGKTFGLKQTWWVDNRRDVMAATDAALNYLEKLHVMFGTWELALAAYNAGEGTVQRAIERNRKRGLPTDYQSLQLPTETKEYVPKLQAVKNIVSNPEQYGLDIQTIANQPYFTKVAAPKQIDAHLAAKLAGISLGEFASLNPEYNRPVLTSSGANHEILLPVGTNEAFSTNLANYNKPLVSWRTYAAKPGERQEVIAHKFGISLSELRNVNDLPSKSKLKTSRTLLVPSNGGSNGDTLQAVNDKMDAAPARNDAAGAETSPGRHIVKSGETIGEIAKHHGMSAAQLMALNHLSSNRLKLGQSLAVKGDAPTKLASGAKSAPSKKTSKTDRKTRYVVRRGETLASIARKFNVAAEDIQRWNSLNGSRITPGHKLTIYRPDAA